MRPEFQDRPTMREWRRHVSRLRWERRLARAPYYRLTSWALLIFTATVLVVMFAIAGTKGG